MPRDRILTVRSPLGGKAAVLDFQTQEPFTLYDCRDMWPIDPVNSRARLSVRAGLSTFGSNAAVNCIATLAVAADSGSQESHLRQLIIAKGGTLYKHTSGTSFSSVGTGIATGRTVHASSYATVLYIASNSSTTYKKYEYDGTVTDWTASPGTLPADCKMIATWQARIVLTGDPANPHVVYFSRIDDPEDWDYTATDSGSAVAVPDINEPVTCLIVHSMDCLLVGTYNSMWVFNGNPTTNGQLRKFSHVVGPINSTAWCKDPYDYTYMLTRAGLYKMAPGCGTPPVSISHESIPESLLGLDGVNDKAFLEYDTRFHCLHIYVQGSNPQYFHFFPATNSFWPVTSPGAGILAIGRYDPVETSDKSGVLIGTTASLLRLDRTATLGGSDMAYACMGPIRISGSPSEKAKIKDAVFTLGADTDDTTGTLVFYTAENSEAVVGLPAGRKRSVTVAEALNNRRTWVNLSGHAHELKYTQGSTAKKFSFEQCNLTIASTGKERTAG